MLGGSIQPESRKLRAAGLYVCLSIRLCARLLTLAPVDAVTFDCCCMVMVMLIGPTGLLRFPVQQQLYSNLSLCLAMFSAISWCSSRPDCGDPWKGSESGSKCEIVWKSKVW